MGSKKQNQEKAEAEVVVEKVKPEYVVAKNKCVTSKKGLLEADREVKAEYFEDGEKTLKELIDKGLVKKP